MGSFAGVVFLGFDPIIASVNMMRRVKCVTVGAEGA